MEFLKSDFSSKLLAVLEIDWHKDDTAVKPRSYNAISLRLPGDSEITDTYHTAHLTTGDLLYMPENVGYHLKARTERILVAHFALNGIKQDSFEVLSFPSQINTLTSIFTSLYDIWLKKETGYYFRAVSLLYRLFGLIEQQQTASLHGFSYELIRPAMDYLYTHFTDSTLTVELLCKICNLSDTYFRRLFYQVFHTTPLNYINTLRINYAEELLQTGFYTISYVANKTGFSDPKYFSTAFKKKKGYPPSHCK